MRMRTLTRLRHKGVVAAMAALAAVAALLAPACAQEPTPTPTPMLSGLLATKDLGVGANRISFLVVGEDAIITAPEASVASRNVSSTDSAVKEQATASFRAWPLGVRGSYVTSLTFDQPGEWELNVGVMNEDGGVSLARIPLEVKEASFTPAIGSEPPMIANKTLDDVILLSELTSWSTPDPDLYMETIPEALGKGRPVLVAFSSPSLCTSPTCGPQIQAVQDVKNRFKGQAGFIHVEVYDNPAEIQGDLSRARYSPVVEAWGLTKIEDYFNESWVFIMGQDGRVMFKYEGFTSAEELAEGLTQALEAA